jgi:mannose-6-phosphate isomerase-like protein (cupin superfamily)
MERPRPAVIPLESVPVIPAQEAPTRVRIARLVTRERCGSNLLLGACWMDPGEETNVWSFAERPESEEEEGVTHYGPVDETYFVIAGRLRLTWDEGELDIGPNDAVYLAPGWRYRLQNVGDVPAFFVYGMAPSPV